MMINYRRFAVLTSKLKVMTFARQPPKVTKHFLLVGNTQFVYHLLRDSCVSTNNIVQ